jgi:predicted chitinase
MGGGAGGGGSGGGGSPGGAGGTAGGGSGGSAGGSDAGMPPGPGGSGGNVAKDAGASPDVRLEPDGPPPICNYPDWMKGKMYNAGDIVMFQGKPYVATSANPGYDPTISTFFWSPYTGCVPPAPAPAAKCAVLDKLLPDGEATFKMMFAAPFMGAVPLAPYSYTNLCDSLAAAPLAGFARSGNATQDKREVAAFFANVALETGYLTAIDERGHSAADHDYHGRGALQITTSPIYSECGGALGLDLSGHPELASQPQNVWKTGLWYWMLHANPSAGGTQVCHAAISQGDFGQTVRIIKGNCGSAGERATQYRKNCGLLGVDPGTTSCN